MVYKRLDPTPIRFSERDLKNIKDIQQCGSFDSTSSTIRFCVAFTKTILSIIPESIAQSYIELEEKNGKITDINKKDNT